MALAARMADAAASRRDSLFLASRTTEEALPCSSVTSPSSSNLAPNDDDGWATSTSTSTSTTVSADVGLSEHLAMGMDDDAMSRPVSNLRMIPGVFYWFDWPRSISTQ